LVDSRRSGPNEGGYQAADSTGKRISDRKWQGGISATGLFQAKQPATCLSSSVDVACIMACSIHVTQPPFFVSTGALEDRRFESKLRQIFYGKNVALGLLTWNNLKINFYLIHRVLLRTVQNGLFMPLVQLIILYYILHYIILYLYYIILHYITLHYMICSFMFWPDTGSSSGHLNTYKQNYYCKFYFGSECDLSLTRNTKYINKIFKK
jgi:hypothetical protein